jgi:hypothetical protein
MPARIDPDAVGFLGNKGHTRYADHLVVACGLYRRDYGAELLNQGTSHYPMFARRI